MGIGKILGGALGIGGAIFGGISASKAMKKVKRNLEGQRRENDDWYNRRYNEDVTQRADAQRIIDKTIEAVHDRTRAAAGAAAVSGASEESVAAAKSAGNEALAEATSQIAAAGVRHKGQVDAQYRSREAEIDAALNNMDAGKAQAIGQAVQGVATAGGEMMDLF